MTAEHRTRFVHEGQYAVAVEVEHIETGDGWSPYLSFKDARRLGEAREALRRGDLRKASHFGKVYQLIPVAG